MHNCVVTIDFDGDAQVFNMNLLEEPLDDEFSLEIVIPFSKKQDRMLSGIMPILHWFSGSFKDKWSNGATRPINNRPSKRIILQHGSEYWVVDQCIPELINYSDAKYGDDSSAICFIFRYDSCINLLKLHDKLITTAG